MKFIKLTILKILILASPNILAQYTDTYVTLYSFAPDSYKEILLQNRSFKISKTVLVSAGDYVDMRLPFNEVRAKVQRENNFIANIAKSNPKDFIAFCSIPWLYPEVDKEVARCINELKVGGFRVQPYKYFRDITYPVHVSFTVKKNTVFLNKMMKYSHDYDLPLTLQSDSISPNDLELILTLSDFMIYPKVRLNFSGFGGYNSVNALNILRSLFKSEYSHYYRGKVFITLSTIIGDFADPEHPQHKQWVQHLISWGLANEVILFATARPWYSIEEMMRLHNSIFSPTALQKIMTQNAANFLDKRSK